MLKKAFILMIGNVVFITALNGGDPRNLVERIIDGATVRECLCVAAHAASPATKNAIELIADMRASLAMIGMNNVDASGSPRHKNAALLLVAVNKAAIATQSLEVALTSQDRQSASQATKNLSLSIGKLQTTYALLPEKNQGTADGFEYLNISWKAYSDRYIFAKPSQGKKTVKSEQFLALRKKVITLKRQISKLKAKSSRNPVLIKELTRIEKNVMVFDSQPNSYLVYNKMLFTVSVADNSLKAFTYATKAYYPSHYVFYQPVMLEVDTDRSYWDDYYTDIDWQWFQEPFIIETPTIADEAIDPYRRITYEELQSISSQGEWTFDNLLTNDLLSGEHRSMADSDQLTPPALMETGAQSEIPERLPLEFERQMTIVPESSQNAHSHSPLDSSLDIEASGQQLEINSDDVSEEYDN